MPNDREPISIKTYAIAGAVMVVLCFIAIGVFLPPWGNKKDGPEAERKNVQAPLPTDGLSNEERAIVRAKLVSVLADSDRTKEVIDGLRLEVLHWETSILPLLTNEEGKPLRGDAFRKRFDDSFFRPQMTKRDVETASEQLAIYREPIQKELDSESYAHDHERASSKIRELLSKVTAELATYKSSSSDIKKLLAESRGAKPEPVSPLQPGTVWAGYCTQTPSHGQAAFPMKVLVKTIDSGTVTGEVHWPSFGLGATVFSGKLEGGRFTFEEKAFARQPNRGFSLALNGQYVASVAPDGLTGSMSGNGATGKFELKRLPTTGAEKADREKSRDSARKKASEILKAVFLGEADAEKKALSMAMHFERWHIRRVNGMVQTQETEWLPFVFWYQTLLGIFKKPETTLKYPVRWELDDWTYKGASSEKTYRLYRAFEKVAKDCPDLFQDTFVTAQAEAISGNVPVGRQVQYVDFITIEHYLRVVRDIYQGDAAVIRENLKKAKQL